MVLQAIEHKMGGQKMCSRSFISERLSDRSWDRTKPIKRLDTN